MTDIDEEMQRTLRVYAKRELRKRMTSIRNVIPEAAHSERSARACERVCALPEFASARYVAGYVAFRKELDPQRALARAGELGKLVLLPRIAEDGLAFHEHDPSRELVENDWGLLEPPADAPRVSIPDIDFMLVPALALDLRGFRIGYGKSFYDRVLPLPRGRAVGLVYDFQLLAEVPNEAHDMPVQIVVTDARTVVV